MVTEAVTAILSPTVVNAVIANSSHAQISSTAVTAAYVCYGKVGVYRAFLTSSFSLWMCAQKHLLIIIIKIIILHHLKVNREIDRPSS